MKAVIVAFALFFIVCASPTVRNKADDIIENSPGLLPLALRFPSDCGEEWKGDIDRIAKRQVKTGCDLWNLARYYHTVERASGSAGRAMKQYEAITATGARHRAMAKNNMACISLNDGKVREAESGFLDMIGGADAIIPAYYNLYILYRHAGRLEDGAKTLLLMKERYPENSYAGLELGDIFFEREDYAMAGRFYREALETNDDNPVSVHRMAVFMEKAGRDDEAEVYYRRCIKSFPGYRQAYIDYSSMLLRQNRKDDARKVLNRAMRLMDHGDGGEAR
ncbi:MAG TPA: tetratricopeptide repeat protein [Spirochaetota bacterium]|nr:tetratricopeptide repeat protein [Spirochaetota bacterium]